MPRLKAQQNGQKGKENVRGNIFHRKMMHNNMYLDQLELKIDYQLKKFIWLIN